MKRLKNTLIVWVAIYPAITFLLFTFGDVLNQLPLFLRTFILTAILVPLMVYFLIPFWTNVFHHLSKFRQRGEKLNTQGVK